MWISKRNVVNRQVYKPERFNPTFHSLYKHCSFLTQPNFLEEEENSETDDGILNIYPKQMGERFMLRLLDFQLKLQVNLGDEGQSPKMCNVSKSSEMSCPVWQPLIMAHVISVEAFQFTTSSERIVSLVTFSHRNI